MPSEGGGEIMDEPVIPEGASKVSRRGMLVGLGVGVAAAIQAAPARSVTAAPAILTGKTTGMRFRALVRSPEGTAVQSLKLLAVPPKEVVIRVKASVTCYTQVTHVFAEPGSPLLPPWVPMVMGHTFVGVVEEVGHLVTRTRVGDRVIVTPTPQCGQCYACLHGRSDQCDFLTVDIHPFAVDENGREIRPRFGLGGIGEIAMCAEEYCVPVWSDLTNVELAVLGDNAGVGLAAGLTLAPIEAGSSVAVVGCGSLGLGAVQSARIRGAGQIIAIDPVRYRREAALKLGATMALDPHAEGDKLVERVRELCRVPTDRPLAGGGRRTSGADFVIEAVGGDRYPPAVEKSPDPKGVLPVVQAWQMTRPDGHVSFTGIAAETYDIAFPSTQLILGGRTIHSAQMGGMHVMRDLPRFVRLVERGLFDAKAIATSIGPLDRAVDIFKQVAERTSIIGIIQTNT
jgi:S-(hydroxymethyl)glutathione dehydrogenase / alcohol dehydrogenase